VYTVATGVNDEQSGSECGESEMHLTLGRDTDRLYCGFHSFSQFSQAFDVCVTVHH